MSQLEQQVLEIPAKPFKVKLKRFPETRGRKKKPKEEYIPPPPPPEPIPEKPKTSLEILIDELNKRIDDLTYQEVFIENRGLFTVEECLYIKKYREVYYDDKKKEQKRLLTQMRGSKRKYYEEQKIRPKKQFFMNIGFNFKLRYALKKGIISEPEAKLIERKIERLE